MSELNAIVSKCLFVLVLFGSNTACSDNPTQTGDKVSSGFNYEIDDKIHSEQVLVMLFDIHVGTDGQVIDVTLAEGQKDQGIFTQAAIKKIRQTQFAVKKVDGVAQAYWQRNQPIEVGSVMSLHD